MRARPTRLNALKREWRAARRSHPRAAGVAAALVAVLALVPALGGGWYAWTIWSGLPTRDAVARIGEMAQTTAVYDYRDELAFTIFKEQRIDAPLTAVSPHLVEAMLAIEDRRFYEHGGFDGIRIAAAALANVREGRAAQGGSTITQQLARLTFLTQEKTIRRKLQELILAGRIERMYSKDRILELYLNKVYFGDGYYGVEAAARGFFGKSASAVSVAEAALLAGLVQSPSSYAPTISAERAIARRNVVLGAMFETGAIDEATRDMARGEVLALSDALRVRTEVGQYFKEAVRRELVERFGWDRVYEGGLRVYSTVDMGMQRAAETAVSGALATLDARRRALPGRRAAPPDAEEEPLQAALIALDPTTGHVRALVGGRDFGESPFNRAMQARRQPGSAFKPFVYAAALEAGYTPATVIDDLDRPTSTPEGDWVPEDEQSSASSLTLRAALRVSSNRAAVRLLQDVGIARTVSHARTMGVGDVPGVPSLALGSGEVTLDRLTAAYAAFANGGSVPLPLLVRRVEDRDGLVLYEAEDVLTPAVSETTAYLMASMLSDVINAGTAAGARRQGFTLPAAGKTGTTNESRDAWFVGFTPRLAAGVWVGFDQPQPILPRGSASDIAVPLWARFMRAATRGHRPTWLTPPESIVSASVCAISGHLASEGCAYAEVVTDEGGFERHSTVYTEYFVRGTAPRAVCSLHPSRGLFGTVASWFADGGGPAPPLVAPSPPPPTDAVAAAVASDQGPAVDAPPPPERRRGFWSRLFRGDRNRSDTRTPDTNRDR